MDRGYQESLYYLLGSGESGKSTILKQFRIMHTNGFSDEELESYRHEIRTNVIQAISTLCKASYGSNPSLRVRFSSFIILRHLKIN